MGKYFIIRGFIKEKVKLNLCMNSHLEILVTEFLNKIR
jgi:hypothetical protein